MRWPHCFDCFTRPSTAENEALLPVALSAEVAQQLFENPDGIERALKHWLGEQPPRRLLASVPDLPRGIGQDKQLVNPNEKYVTMAWSALLLYTGTWGGVLALNNFKLFSGMFSQYTLCALLAAATVVVAVDIWSNLRTIADKHATNILSAYLLAKQRQRTDGEVLQEWPGLSAFIETIAPSSTPTALMCPTSPPPLPWYTRLGQCTKIFSSGLASVAGALGTPVGFAILGARKALHDPATAEAISGSEAWALGSVIFASIVVCLIVWLTNYSENASKETSPLLNKAQFLLWQRGPREVRAQEAATAPGPAPFLATLV